MNRLPASDDRRWLVKTVFSRWHWTLPAAILVAGGFLANGVVPVLVGRAIDDAIAPLDSHRLLFWMGVLVVVFAANMVMVWFGRILMQQAILNVGHDLRMATTDRISAPEGMGGKKRTAGELLSIASSDTQRVADAVFMTVFPVAEMASILYVGIVMLTIDIRLGIAVLLGGPITVAIAMRAAVPLRKASARRQQALAKAASMAADVVEGLRTLKGLGAVTTVNSRYGAVSDRAYARTVEANRAQARLNAITEGTGAFYVIAIALGAGILAADGQISVGQLITAIGLTQFIIMPLTMFGRNIASRLAPAQASARRIRGVLGAPARWEPDSGEVPDLPAGLTVVTGPAPDSWLLAPRDRVLISPRHAELIDGTVSDNIHPDTERAAEAMFIASVEDIPGGADKPVGESGGNLSGGQRQRVALARAIAAESEVLVLQDPTTAVDSVTEQRIAQRVAEHRGERPTLVYTTAPAWQAVARRVTDNALGEVDRG
ncbi:hypothetical protein C3B44_05900 [Corynebacterium yudongzhengii]|uniref:ABC transporter ATP-binding protein n=1 Tax=Corynebacterium yudongzhengii TaxID=2080740 RepID=A0A2U1T8R3_9CORY|nr:ABC transporter ATP-binding protein [Corynebacterium yudongzhengii]AWB81943.1 hypothetical protein C3B44_05900 [Corynebacterium yudongzhengii]PWC02335.1 ABC transporter ATP-binding protein [Corynebacterium yudongzhengii]